MGSQPRTQKPVSSTNPKSMPRRYDHLSDLGRYSTQLADSVKALKTVPPLRAMNLHSNSWANISPSSTRCRAMSAGSNLGTSCQGTSCRSHAAPPRSQRSKKKPCRPFGVPMMRTRPLLTMSMGVTVL